MSHFAVAVFSDDADFARLLAPYNEANENYFVFQPVGMEKIRSDFEKFKKENPSWTFDMYLKAYNYVEHEGQWGYFHNPNGFWDWYSLDGREYMYDVKADADIDEYDWNYRKNDYDWYPQNDVDVEEAEEFWDTYIAGDEKEGYPSIWSKQYYIDRYKTKEQYIKEMSRTLPWAFITPDGVWHSAGRCGWFACSDETAEDADRYAKEWDEWIASDANPYVNLVDCHI